jgi:uncharacterized RDD family membrane protein YckC
MSESERERKRRDSEELLDAAALGIGRFVLGFLFLGGVALAIVFVIANPDALKWIAGVAGCLVIVATVVRARRGR